MIQGVKSHARYLNTPKTKIQQTTTSPIHKIKIIPFQKFSIPENNIALALQAQTLVPLAKTISFTGVFDDLDKYTKPITVCKDEKSGKQGETVGSKLNVTKLISNVSTSNDLKKSGNAAKIDIEIDRKEKETENGEKKTIVTEARTQLKNIEGKNFLFEMAVKPERDINSKSLPSGSPSAHTLSITMKMPTKSVKPTKNDNMERVSILNTKGKLTAVLEDGNNVLLTSAGSIEKNYGEKLAIECKKEGRKFEPFTIENTLIIEKLTPQQSIGKGGEIVIGMEDGRFNAEIIDSIKKFQKKLENEEIVLPQFVAKEGAEKIQIAMLAGGFGSRAEYTNAASKGIFHGKENGAQSTKGVFRTSTGLTPMETTFVSLHMAGLLDCSKGNFAIGKNVNFYLNKSGINKGNGGFTLDLYKKMIKENHNCEFIFPNDSISRMPIAIEDAAEKMNEGNTAIAMIAKKVPAKEAKGTFGIMKLSDDNEILEFAEKPNPIPKGFADTDDNCLTNTFQFAVSKEAFEALELIEPELNKSLLLKGKETRDWSKHLIPIIMVLTQCETPDEMRNQLPTIVGEKNNSKYVNFLEEVPDETLMEAKEILHGQKVIAVPTDESWADVGQAAALYDVTMSIAKGDFKLLDFERKNVIDSIDTKTGLVAMSKSQKEEIEKKYKIEGEVLAVPTAEKIPSSILNDYSNNITINY